MRTTLPQGFFQEYDDKVPVVIEYNELQEDYLSYREELARSLYINLASVKGPFHQTFLQALSQLFTKHNHWTEIEQPLFLLYHLQQAIPANQREDPLSSYA